MATTQKILCGLLATLILAFGAIQPSPVLAALSISSVTPNQVVNDVNHTLTIAGSDFAPEALVKIGGSDPAASTALVTNRISDSELLANLPKDFAPGVYTVYVVNPGETVSLPAGLTVLAPTPVPTSTPGGFSRPQLALKSYSINVGSIKYGQNFILSAQLENLGGARAVSIQVSFVSPELLMLKNGGVISLGALDPAAKVNLSQTMTAASPLSGSSLTTLEMNVSYYDGSGAPYSDKFTLNLKTASSSTSGGYYAVTPTPTAEHTSRLMISEYQTDIVPLEPGLQFTLELTIINKGDLAAKSALMIVGGGSGSSGNYGTPGPGGISGSGGDFTNFAPVNSSNIQSLGDIPAQGSLRASQGMIVNVNTSPGVYPMKISFSYTDQEGRTVNDEQIITLLVYSLPRIEIDFYQPVGEFFTGQSNLLPIQIVNVGRRYAVLSNLTVTSQAGPVENGQLYIGYLDTGGYITLDAFLFPQAAGQAEVQVDIAYTDDFNQMRTITSILTVPVYENMAEPVPDPGSPEFSPDQPYQQSESFWQKIWRFILGLFGLDSSAPVEAPPIQTEPEIAPPPSGYKPGKG